jgi:hypothetical protein
MPQEWKMPPKAKVYEALSAVVDGRVFLQSACEASVTSSSGNKAYVVRWNDDFTGISSNDNASFYQGYIGYPIIAVLLKTGTLKADLDSSEKLKGIPWKKINDQFKRNYDKAVDFVLDEAQITEQERMVDKIYHQLSELKLSRISGKMERPPQP